MVASDKGNDNSSPGGWRGWNQEFGLALMKIEGPVGHVVGVIWETVKYLSSAAERILAEETDLGVISV